MRIAMLLHKSVEHDSRVRREARALAQAGHDVTVLHLPRTPGELDGELDGFSVRSVTPPAWVRHRLPFGLYRLIFLAAFVLAVRRLRPDAVHAHDAAMLAPGYLGARLTGARLVYDSHEYAAGVPYRERAWALFVTTLERTLIRRCDAVITVSDGIAERLHKRYRLGERPVVLRNLPDPEARDPEFRAPDLRAELGIDPSSALVLHLGAVARDRGCEMLVVAMTALEHATLLFLGADDHDYVDRLRRIAEDAGVAGRVHFRPSVSVAHVPAYVQQASAGVSLLEDTCDNHRLALPNKVFDYLAAGVPAVVSDLPAIRRLVEAGAEVEPARADDPADVAQALHTVLARPPVGPDQRTVPAGHGLSWAEERIRLVDVYSRLGPSPGAPGSSRRALVLARNPCTHDARILRECETLLGSGYDTLVLGVISEGAPARTQEVAGVRIHRLAPTIPGRRLLRRLRETRRKPVAAAGQARGTGGGVPLNPGALVRFGRLLRTADYYRRGIGVAIRTRPDLVHCNDYNTAWIGVAAKSLVGSRMVYDAHELWPDRNLRPEPRWWLLLCESLFVRAADRTITTSPGYASVMASRYRIPTPAVVRNIPAWDCGNGSAETAWSGDRTVVYFGAITENRGLETAIEALTYSPQLRIRLIGPDAWGYRERLALRAEQLGVAERLSLDGPVAPEDARDTLVGAAVGLALIEPSCLSYRLTLPNKLFEYTMAGVPILASDVPVTAAFVRDRSLGFVADPRDPRQVASALEQMLRPDVQARMRKAVSLAQAEFSWEAEREHLVRTYRAADAPRRR